MSAEAASIQRGTAKMLKDVTHESCSRVGSEGAGVRYVRLGARHCCAPNVPECSGWCAEQHAPRYAMLAALGHPSWASHPS